MNNNKYFLINQRILEVGLVEDKSILEISRELNSKSPFELGRCTGQYCSGNSKTEAYCNALSKMSNKTIDAIKERVSNIVNVKELCPDEILNVCKLNNINISDIVLMSDITFDGNVVFVIFIEQDNFEQYTGFELKDASDEEKNNILKESIEHFSIWKNNNVFCWKLYNRNGDKLAFGNGYYGENVIKQSIETFANCYNVRSTKNLGTYSNIRKCINSNKNSL